jgi:hypothetical protein
MEWLFSWGVVSVVVAVLIGVGFGFLALNDFKLAKLCFLLAAADAIGGMVMWGVRTDIPPWLRTGIIFASIGLIGVLTVQSFRYVDQKKELKAINGRHLREEQKKALQEFGGRIPPGVFFYVYAVSNSTEAEAYGKEIWDAIGTRGRNGSYVTWAANVQPIPTGLIVSSMLTPPVGSVFTTASDLGMTMRKVGMPNVSGNNYAPMDRNPNSVTLVVGVKPSFD